MFSWLGIAESRKIVTCRFLSIVISPQYWRHHNKKRKETQFSSSLLPRPMRTLPRNGIAAPFMPLKHVRANLLELTGGWINTRYIYFKKAVDFKRFFEFSFFMIILIKIIKIRRIWNRISAFSSNEKRRNQLFDFCGVECQRVTANKIVLRLYKFVISIAWLNL